MDSTQSLKTTQFILICLFFFNQSFATPQIKDRFISGNDTFGVWNTPLETYLNAQNISLSNFCSTDCWRGYFASWKIEHDSLWLVDLRSCCGGAIAFNTIFPDALSDKPIFADWVTDTFTIPLGARLKWIHIGLGREKEKDYAVRQGILVSQLTYQHLTLTEEEHLLDSLTAFFLQKIQWQYVPKNDKSVLVTVGIQLDTHGNRLNTSLVNSENVFYNYEALRLVGLIEKLPIRVTKPDILITFFIVPVRFPPKR